MPGFAETLSDRILTLEMIWTVEYNDLALSAHNETALSADGGSIVAHILDTLGRSSLLGLAAVALALAACAPQTKADPEGTRQAHFAEFAATLTAQPPATPATASPQLQATPSALPEATETVTATATAAAPTPTAAPSATPVEPTATATPAPTDTPAPTATVEPVPTDTQVPTATPAAGDTPTVAPVPPAAEPTPQQDSSPQLAVTFTDLMYQCEMQCAGGENAVWSYRSFQVKMTIINNSTDKPVDWNWEPQRWFITDGANTRVNEGSWEWVARANNWKPYAKPVVAPGAGAEWTFITMPIGEHEWVSAVEFEAWGHVYRQEFDLGPTGTAHDYKPFCGLTPPDTSCGRK